MKRLRLLSVVVLPALVICGCKSAQTTETSSTAPAAPAAPPMIGAEAPKGPLGMTDVAQMAQAHVSDELIIGQIHATNAVFHLSATDLIWLKQNNVSDRVVQEMQATASAAPPAVATVAAPTYVVEPAAPVYVGFDYGYYRHRW